MELCTPMSLHDLSIESAERVPLDITRPRRHSMRRLVRQQSIMDTQKTSDGAMQLTYWF